MNVVTFRNRFEPLILAGAKTLTIRAPRKDGRPRAKAGERVSLRVWTGKPYWSKQREFAQATIEHLIPMRITTQGVSRTDAAPPNAPLDRGYIARRDGFANWREMRAFFDANRGLPFEGVMIVWRDLTPTKA